MTETQIRRPDGSSTTIPELLQELAAKEAGDASSRTAENSGDRAPFVDAAPNGRSLRQAGHQQR